MDRTDCKVNCPLVIKYSEPESESESEMISSSEGSQLTSGLAQPANPRCPIHKIRKNRMFERSIKKVDHAPV